MRFDVNKICFLGMYSALLRMYGVNVSEEELLVGCKKITFEHHYVYENKKSDDEWKKSDYCYYSYHNILIHVLVLLYT